MTSYIRRGKNLWDDRRIHTGYAGGSIAFKREMIEELSQTLSAHTNRIREAIQVPGIHEPAMFQQVMLGLAVDQPLEAIFFPGILDGLSGRLGLMPPGVVDPPTSARVGMSQ